MYEVIRTNWNVRNGYSAKKSHRDLVDEMSLGVYSFQRLGDACRKERFMTLRVDTGR